MTSLEGHSPLAVQTIPSVDSAKEFIRISYTEPIPSPEGNDITLPPAGEDEAIVRDEQHVHSVKPERARHLASLLSTKEQASNIAAC